MQNLVSLLQDFYTIIVNIHLKVAKLDFPKYYKINQFRILMIKYQYKITSALFNTSTSSNSFLLDLVSHLFLYDFVFYDQNRKFFLRNSENMLLFYF